jgi:membrane protein implicated in regulation of membrane protease activity
MSMNLRTALGVVATAILIILGVLLLFFGIIFAMASSVANTATRLSTAMLLFIGAVVLFIVGGVTGYYVSRKPKTTIQRLEVSGEMKAVTLKCPNCSGSIDSNAIKIVSGVPYATCPYCGHTFEVTEEPKW